MPFYKMFLKHLRILPQRSKTLRKETANRFLFVPQGYYNRKNRIYNSFLKINIIMKKFVLIFLK